MRGAACLDAYRGITYSTPAEELNRSCARAYAKLDADERRNVDGLGSVHSWEVFMRLLEARDPARQKITAADVARKPDVSV